MKKIIFLLLLALFGSSALYAQHKKGKSKKNKQTSTGGRQTYRLMLDFISHGNGIDNATYSKVEGFANTHPKKPSFNVVEQGREGEKKMYFGLSELTEDEQYAFVDQVSSMIPDRKMVIVNSNLSPRAKGVAADVNVAPPVEPLKYRLVVSFISKGAGVDYKSAEKLEEYVKNHPKKPAFEVKNWGREGEKDYLFMLKELNDAEQTNFVNSVKNLVSSQEMVFVKENEPYQRKGR